MTSPPLGAAAVRFRTAIIDALVRVDPERFWYIDPDTCAGACPICGDILSVYFAGTAPRADIVCRSDCTEGQVGKALARLAPGARA